MSPSYAGVGSSWSSYLFLEVFIAEEVDGLGVVVSGETTVTMHRHSWEAFFKCL
jgi:hypothetical protein